MNAGLIYLLVMEYLQSAVLLFLREKKKWKLLGPKKASSSNVSDDNQILFWNKTLTISLSCSVLFYFCGTLLHLHRYFSPCAAVSNWINKGSSNLIFRWQISSPENGFCFLNHHQCTVSSHMTWESHWSELSTGRCWSELVCSDLHINRDARTEKRRQTGSLSRLLTFWPFFLSGWRGEHQPGGRRCQWSSFSHLWGRGRCWWWRRHSACYN